MNTPRENLLSLYRRRGFESVPVDFAMTPALERQWGLRFPTAGDYRDYYHLPIRRVTEADAAAEVVELHARGLAAEAGLSGVLFEAAAREQGFKDLLLAMGNEDQAAAKLLDALTEAACARAVAFARAGVDLLLLGDDMAALRAPLLPVETYRRWLRPRLARIITAARAEQHDLLVVYRSRGNVLPFIEDFIRAGVDILDPVSPESLSFPDVYARFGDRLSFHGTLSAATVLRFGTPSEVRRVTHANLALAGPDGGLLCCPTDVLDVAIPWENVEAYLHACSTFAG